MSNKRLIISCLAATLAFGVVVAAPARADLFGESDEEKAARQQHEDNQDAQINQLNQRLHDLEDSLRQVTGQNEVLSHRIQELNDKIDHQQKDFEYRLCQMQAQQLGVGASADQAGDQPALPCNQGGAATMMQNAAPQNLPSGPQTHLAPGPGVLGTLPQNAIVATPPPSDNRAQFDAALNLLAKGRNDEAAASFRTFADTYPKDDLAPQAVYWVGAIAFTQKDYANAARAFAEEIKKYPTSTRGPDSMLKLGQSLLALGQKKEGCTTLGALASRYPTASKAVTAEAVAERKASCH